MSARKRVALFGGSFDPVHAAHLMLAQYVAEFCGFDEVWLNLSPANPLKEGPRHASDADRLKMLAVAVGNHPRLKICSVELMMPRPSYTINTLRRLSEKCPDTDFTLLIGTDQLAQFDRWRSWEEILRDYGVAVYPRDGYDIPSPLPEGVTLIDAPHLEVSSTFIRDAIRDGRDVNFFLPPGVYNYILTHNLYR